MSPIKVIIYGLDDRGSSLQRITRVLSREEYKAVGAWNWLLTAILYQDHECFELHLQAAIAPMD
jgi:hypothetical protein